MNAFVKNVADQVHAANVKAVENEEKLRMWRKRFRDNDNYELIECHYCEVPFEYQDDYQWICGVSEQECHAWCGECTLNKLVLCVECDYGTCIDHLHEDGICENCKINGGPA